MHSLLECSGHRSSSNALPHCPGAVGSGTPAMDYRTACEQWAVELLPRKCAATLLGGSGQRNFCKAPAHQLGGRGFSPRRRSLPKERNFLQCTATLPRVVGNGNDAISCYIAWGKRAVETRQRTARGRQPCNSCNALPHAQGRWAVQVLQCSAPLPGGSGTPIIECHIIQCIGHWNSCTTAPYRLGAVGDATPAPHCPTA